MKWNSSESCFFFSSRPIFSEKHKQAFVPPSDERESGKSERNTHTATEDKALNLKFGIYTPHYFDLSVCSAHLYRKKRGKKKKALSFKWFDKMILFLVCFFLRLLRWKKDFKCKAFVHFNRYQHIIYMHEWYLMQTWYFASTFDAKRNSFEMSRHSQSKIKHTVCVYGFGARQIKRMRKERDTEKRNHQSINNRASDDQFMDCVCAVAVPTTKNANEWTIVAIWFGTRGMAFHRNSTRWWWFPTWSPFQAFILHRIQCRATLFFSFPKHSTLPLHIHEFNS